MMTEKEATVAATTFKLFADPVRIQILSLIAAERMNVTSICTHVKKEQAAVSHHIALLRISGLIESEREGKCNYYSIHFGKYRAAVETMNRIAGLG